MIPAAMSRRARELAGRGEAFVTATVVRAQRPTVVEAGDVALVLGAAAPEDRQPRRCRLVGQGGQQLRLADAPLAEHAERGAGAAADVVDRARRDRQLQIPSDQLHTKA